MKDWHSLSKFKKRLHGFACYTVSAFVSLFISPEVADMVMYKTLKEQFESKKYRRIEVFKI